MALFRTQNEDVCDYDIVWSRVGKGSNLHRDLDAPELAGEEGEPLSQLYGKEASSAGIFLQVTLGFWDYVYVIYCYFLSINDFSHMKWDPRKS